MKVKRKILMLALLASAAASSLLVLRRPEPIDASRFMEPDRLFRTVEANVRSQPEFEVIVEIDHARLGADAGSPMPPSRVLIWSDPELDAAILQLNPVAAVDLPLRILAYEDQETGKAAIITNGYEYLAGRYALPDAAAIRDRYEAALAKATKGIPADAIASFPSDSMPDAGLVRLTSPHDFAGTVERILEAINAQSDTVIFGSVDFSERSKEYGIDLRPLRLILFGGPGPGGRAMASAPTLGLDAFCQKLVIWQGEDGTVYVTFNDLSALANRQNVSAGLPLRVINRRLKNTFSAAIGQ